MLHLKLTALDLFLTLLTGLGGIGGAWLLRRYSTLSVRNLYAPATVLGGLCLMALLSGRGHWRW